jgi:hypothetical protein
MASKRSHTHQLQLLGRGEKDLLDDLEVAVLEFLRAIFEVLLHSSLDLMRSVVLTLSVLVDKHKTIDIPI